MGTMTLSAAERARVNNRKTRRTAQRMIATDYQEYLDERYETQTALSRRELILLGINPDTMMEVTSSKEFWAAVETLGEITAEELFIARETAHVMEWLEMMMESWDEWLNSQSELSTSIDA